MNLYVRVCVFCEIFLISDGIGDQLWKSASLRLASMH